MAVDFAKKLAEIKRTQNIETSDILAIHQFILQKIHNEYAEKYPDVPVRILGSTIPTPNIVLFLF